MAADDIDAARVCVPAGYAYFNNQADDILAVGAAMMRGEMAYHAGETEAGFNWLREAVAAEDRLVYTSRVPGCIRRATRLARCCWSRGASTRRAASISAISAMTKKCRSAARIAATSGPYRDW